MPPRLTRARVRSRASRILASLRTRARYAALAVSPGAHFVRHEPPTDFGSWVERGLGRGATSGRFPDAWTKRDDIPIASPTRVGVVAHVFFPELLEDLVRRLASIPVAFDLIVTNASGEPIRVDQALLPNTVNVLVLEVENRGRDLWPLAQVVNAGLLDPYHLVLKIHTKRSAWRDDHDGLPGTGSAWRDQLLDAILADGENVTAILEAFATNPRLGLVTADGSVLGPEFWGDNEGATANLLRRLELVLQRTELTFAAGSMYWARGFLLQGLRALCLSAADFENEAGQVNGTTAHALERLVGIVAREAGLSIVARSQLPRGRGAGAAWRRFERATHVRPRVRVVPFYLPQFHPIPENDRWWGPGFTEWSNVAAAKPVFPGHHQPKLPTTTGFYDLRLRESRALQVQLARDAGIHAFMYYHYWFAGHPLLETPIQSRLGDAEPFPFCVMWANENWTRRWDGRDDDVLIGQRYDVIPSARFIIDAMPILRDPRYLRVGGRAVLAVYRPRQVPDLPVVIAAWREAARVGGVGELLVLHADVEPEFDGMEGDLRGSGLDGSLGFPPHSTRRQWISPQSLGAVPGFAGHILSYGAVVEDSARRMSAGFPDGSFPGVMVAFDNTARRQRNPDIWYGANPYTFRRWLAAAAASVTHRDLEQRIVFVNAWNEWSEGAVLEPTDRHGPTYLLAVRDVTLG